MKQIKRNNIVHHTLLRIREAPGSIIGPTVGYPDTFSLYLRGNYALKQATAAFFHFHLNLSPTSIHNWLIWNIVV
jgi:hypothetical protein